MVLVLKSTMSNFDMLSPGQIQLLSTCFLAFDNTALGFQAVSHIQYMNGLFYLIDLLISQSDIISLVNSYTL